MSTATLEVQLWMNLSINQGCCMDILLKPRKLTVTSSLPHFFQNEDCMPVNLSEGWVQVDL